MPFLTNDPLPQCLQHNSATGGLLGRDHARGCRRYLLKVKCLENFRTTYFCAAIDCYKVLCDPRQYFLASMGWIGRYVRKDKSNQRLAGARSFAPRTPNGPPEEPPAAWPHDRVSIDTRGPCGLGSVPAAWPHGASCDLVRPGGTQTWPSTKRTV